MELLVASVVTILVVGLLLAVTHGISTNYNRTQDSIARRGDTAVALDQIIQDLESYVVPNFPNGEAIQVTPETVGDASNTVWLTLLSTAVDKDNSDPNPNPSSSTNMDFTGATRAISYRLARQNTIDASSTDTKQPYAIYRSISSAKHVFANVVTTTTNMQSQYWTNIAPSPSPAPTSPTDIGNFLAENIVSFTVRFQKRDRTWTLPSDNVRIARNGSTANGITVEGGFIRAQVSITVLSNEGARRVKNGVLSLANAITRYGQISVRETVFF